MADTPEEGAQGHLPTQNLGKPLEVDAQPLNSTLEALAAPALVDFNSWLEVKFLLEWTCAYSQKELLSLIDMEAFHCLVSSITEERDIVRLRCVAQEEAGYWLGALPSKALGHLLRRSEFVLTWQYQLGICVFMGKTECLAPRCRAAADGLGDHSLSYTIEAQSCPQRTD